MASIGEVAERVARVVELAGRCRAALVVARDLAEDAGALLSAALHGADGLEADAAEALRAIAAVVEGVQDGLLPRLDGVVARLEAVRARLIGEAGAADPETPPDYPADRIERIRESLPPPVVVGAGQQTRGRWIAPNGRDYPISSGLDSRSELVDAQLAAKGLADRETIRKGDVEMKLAADMAATGIRHVTVVINHRPCRGRYNCHTLVPILLPEGYTLTVYGITSSGTRTRVRYTGGAEPWWR